MTLVGIYVVPPTALQSKIQYLLVSSGLKPDESQGVNIREVPQINV